MGYKISQFLYRFMAGRNGVDALARAESIFFLIIWVLNLFLRSGLVSILLLAILIHTEFRIFSRNTAKRYAENQKYQMARYKFTVWWQKKRVRWSQREMCRYFRCPKCRQEVRVPAKRGKICITCPKCRTEFVKRT